MGSDPELRYTQGGTAVANCNIAVDDFRKGQDGNSQKVTSWFKLIFWGKTAETLNQYCRKGNKIAISGRLSENKWEDKDGNKRSSVEIHVNSLDLPAKSDNGGDQPPNTNGAQHAGPGYNQPPPAQSTEDDSIPF
jgi:single-strand DNA-binding protein